MAKPRARKTARRTESKTVKKNYVVLRDSCNNYIGLVKNGTLDDVKTELNEGCGKAESDGFDCYDIESAFESDGTVTVYELVPVKRYSRGALNEVPLA